MRCLGWVAAAVLAAACNRVDTASELVTSRANFEAGNYREAAIRLTNVIEAEPDNVEARLLRGRLALAVGDYDGAVQELGRARSLGAAAEGVALELAEAEVALGRAEEALATLDAAAAALEGDPAYWTLRGAALLRSSRLADAEAALEAGARAGDGGARAAAVRARLALARNDGEAAASTLTRALEAAPDDPDLLAARAELFSAAGRVSEAAADLSRAADVYRARSLEFRETRVLLELVQMHLAVNDLDSAEATGARLAERAPGAALTSYFRGLTEYRRGRFDEAANLVQPLVMASPETPQFRALLGAIHLARGSLFQAEQQFLTVLSTSPRDPAAVKLLAETRLRQERPEAALEALRQVEGTAADDPQVGLLSGLANLLTGNTEQGLAYLEQAASLDPANELLRVQLARAYLAVGRDAEAAALLRPTSGAGSASLDAGLMRLFADLRSGGQGAGEDAAAALLAEFPREPRALTAVAIAMQLKGDTARARALFEQAAGLEVEGATARMFVAAALVQEGRGLEAERLLERVVEQQPDNAQVLMALAELRMSRGAFDDAAALLGAVAERSPTSAPRLALAQLRIRQGDLAAAKREVEAAAQISPDDARVLAVQGLLTLAEGRTKDAVALLERADTLLPNRLGISLALARAQLADGAPAAAEGTLRRVLAVAPDSLPLRLALGQVTLRLGDAAEATAIATALKADFPAQSAGYLLDADVQIAARRYGAAADSLETAYRREPGWPVLGRLIGTLQLAGRSDEARRLCEEWLAANANHVPAMLTLAGLLQQAGSDQQAFDAYRRVLDLDAANVPALNNGAWLAHELKRPEALALAQRAHALAGDNAAVLDTLGWVLLAENREAEAIAHLSRAAELAPGALEIRYHLAAALAAGGRPAEARSQLEAVLGQNREFQQRDEARRLLDSL